MDRAAYIKIRSSLHLEKKSTALAFHLIQDLVLIAGVIALWRNFPDSASRFLAVPLVFAVIFRGFGIMHDAVHGAVAKTGWLNDFMGVLGGSYCLLPFEPWKQSHLQHHRWSGNVEKDPVMALINVFPKMPQGMQTFISKSWKAWLPILGLLQHVVFWKLSLQHLVKGKASAKLVFSLFSPILFWSAVFALVPASFSLSILLPSLFVYFFAIEVVNFPHHLGLPQHRGETKFLAWEQYQTARSCIYPKWFARSVILNFNYHTEHHMFPDVPWYHLDKLHGPVLQSLQGAYNSDLYFAWVIENKKKEMSEVLSPPPQKNPGRFRKGIHQEIDSSLDKV